jgi:hypothetical protein
MAVEGLFMSSAKQSVFDRLKRLLRIGRRRKETEPPAADPYAYVTAPKKPRPSSRSGAAVLELPEE